MKRKEGKIMEKLLEAKQRFSFVSLPLFFLCLLFLDISFRLFYGFLGSTPLFGWKPTVFSLCWALLFTSIAALLPRIIRRIFMAAVTLAYSAFALTHCIIYNIYGHLFTFSDTFFAGNVDGFFSWSYIGFRKAFAVCVVVVFIGVIFAIVLAERYDRNDEKSKKVKRYVTAASLAVFSALVICVMNFAMLPESGGEYDPVSEGEIYARFSDADSCVMMTGLYQYTARDAALTFGLDGQSGSRTESSFSSIEDPHTPNEMTGALEGKNFIMVMMESVDTWLVTPEYMPNLYRVKENGVDLENFYTPLFLTAGTFGTEIFAQTGLIPVKTGLRPEIYGTNSFPCSMANLFKNKGYSANSFHGASPEVYDRGNIHVNWGYEAYHGSDEMKMADFRLDSQMSGGYDLMVKDEPFFTYIITYSGHGPYNKELDGIAAPNMERAKAAVARSGMTSSDKNMDEYTRAVSQAMETDEFVGSLIDYLEENGLLENTVLLFFTDHYGKYISDKEFIENLKNVTAENRQDLYRTPCFIYGGGIEKQKISKVCTPGDIIPTAANLFHLTDDFSCYAGSDIFSEGTGLAAFPDYSWYDGQIYHTPDYGGEETEYTKSQTLKAAKRIDISREILKSDSFKDKEEG